MEASLFMFFYKPFVNCRIDWYIFQKKIIKPNFLGENAKKTCWEGSNDEATICPMQLSKPKPGCACCYLTCA